MWDYEGDGYVHRLIREKEGKVVELGVAERAAVRGEGEGGAGASGRRKGDVDEWEEGKEVEWGMLLSAQLDTQREWYEERMEEVRAEAERERTALVALEAREQELVALLEAERAREREREEHEERAVRALRAAQTKLTDASARIGSLSSALATERALSKGLLENLERAREREAREKEAREQMEGRVRDLEEQVRDLMVFIEVGRRIEDAAGEGTEGGEADALGEARGGSVVMPPPSTNGSGDGKKRKGRKR